MRSHHKTPIHSEVRIVDRLDRRFVNALTVLGFAIPVMGYFWFLSRLSVDAIVGDQWGDVAVIQKSYVHFFDWGSLWARRNESRVFFPNIIVVLLAHTVHFDVRIEEYLGALMLVAATVFLIWAHKRRSPSTPWLYYCPVVILVFSVVQYGNTLWGFQLAWFLVLLALATTVLLLDRITLNWITLIGAVAAAVVGSFSLVQGLLIWPTGLVLLYFRRRPLPYVVVWIAAAVASTALYLYNYSSAGSPYPQYAIRHPLAALKFFLFSIGDVIGNQATKGSANTFVVVFGLGIFILAVGTLLICGFRRDERGGSPIGVALIVFGLLFAAMITQGRSYYGYWGASWSRYTTFDLLILVGVYVALLGRKHVLPTDQQGSRTPEEPPVDSRWWPAGRVRDWSDRVALPIAQVVVVVAIAIQIPFGVRNGVQQASDWHAWQVKTAEVLRNIDHEPNSAVVFYLDIFLPQSSAHVIRDLARTLQEHRLSVFAGSSAH